MPHLGVRVLKGEYVVTRILLSRRWATMTTKLRSMTRVLPLTVLALCLPALVLAQTNPCDTPITQQTVLTSLTNGLVASLDNHLSRLPDDSDFVTKEYRYREYNAMSGNPTTGPFLLDVTIPRANWALVAASNNCYKATVTQTPVVPRFAVLKGTLEAINNGGIPNAQGDAPSNPFVLALVRVGAPRRGQF